MRKSILVASALGMLSFAACKDGGNNSQIVQKWQVVIDNKAVDSAFEAQLKSFDTMTVFPKDFLAMKEEVAKMKPEELKNIPQQTLEMLKINNIDTFKIKLREGMIADKKAQDEMQKNRAVIFEFRKDSVIKNYATDNLNMTDTSTGYKYDAKSKMLFLFGNPKVVKTESKDTMKFKVVHLSADSMSLMQETAQPMPGMKPMNFKRYEEKKSK